MHKLSWIIENLKDRQIAKATFAIDSHWYIIRTFETFRYCDENGENIGDIILLTFSNLRASYEIVN